MLLTNTPKFPVFVMDPKATERCSQCTKTTHSYWVLDENSQKLCTSCFELIFPEEYKKFMKLEGRAK